MNPRELIILTLGLAIIAVVLRGLYVALKARRGQIKLSIDKNIPQDIDLEAMELAELPGGGARVVERPATLVAPQNSKLDEAQERANALNLGDLGSTESNIPVLMDAVELRESASMFAAESERVTPATIETETSSEAEMTFEAKDEQFQGQEIPREHSASLSPELDDQEWPGTAQPPILESPIENEIDLDDEAYGREAELQSPVQVTDKDHGLVSGLRDEAEPDGEHDDVLLDYDQNDYGQDNYDQNDPAEKGSDQIESISIADTDAVATIAPDYVETQADIESVEHEIEEDWESDDPSLERGFSRLAPEHGVQTDVGGLDQSSSGELEESDEADSSDLADDSANNNSQSFEEQLDDFSMTAGDRIGYDNNIIKAVTAARSAPEEKDAEVSLSEQPVLLENDKDGVGQNSHSDDEGSKRTSFLSAFRRKPKETPGQSEVEKETGSEAAGDKESDNEKDEVIAPSAALNGTLNVTEDSITSSANKPAQSDDAKPIDSDDKAVANNQPAEVLVLNVMARDGLSFAGDDLLQVLITAGLKFGEMNIFHHHIGSNTKGPVLYSVANVLNPGTFDLNKMSDFSTLGVSFFLALPTSINNLDAFETMLSVAQQVKNSLDGDLRDDERNLMTAQTIEHYRQRVRDFELRQLKAGIRG